MKVKNEMQLRFRALAENEGLARLVISAFCVQQNPTLDVLTDVKTAVSEAVTNAIVHGYREMGGEVVMNAALYEDGTLSVEIADAGCGIENVEQAMQPFFTTGLEGERSGMGFSVMKTFMDDVEVRSHVGEGTRVRMTKKIRTEAE